MTDTSVERGSPGDRPSQRHGREVGSPPPALEVEEQRDTIDLQETCVRYYFPVEIEVRNVLEAVDTEEIVSLTLDRLATRLENS